MRLLLDECVPWPMRKVLTGHSCTTAQRVGWDAITTAVVIALTEADFDLFVTSGAKVPHPPPSSHPRLPSPSIPLRPHASAPPSPDNALRPLPHSRAAPIPSFASSHPPHPPTVTLASFPHRSTFDARRSTLDARRADPRRTRWRGISKARKRWGTAVFERLFSRVVLQCVEAGLVGSEKAHVDSSLVRANASLNAMVQNIAEEQVAKLEDDADTEEEPRPPKHKPVNTTYRNKTDPDSRVVHHDGGKSLPCYKNHRVVDDKGGVVTAMKTTHGVANEAAEMMDLLGQHDERTGQKPTTVVADSCYGDTANLVALAQARTRHTSPTVAVA